MPYNADQVSILQAELTSDPLTIGYVGMTDQEAADSLLAATRTKNRDSMSRQEVYENIEATALAALTATELAQINLALSDTVDPFGNAQQVFVNVFGSGSATIAALAAARVASVSRLVELGLPEVENASLVGWVTEIRS